ncbi:hypothetical protein HF520_12980 [Romboutsia sp. CE17]|uniref:hypothetical protein n=1 Tax=Romboutsia sp. CE17 TaxID=2724150 RepID=UPI001442D4E8|nr:hypothetical protein [Romboutsia sp. CE17]QJA09776.1 hypothetical protein HF520_12980 [Romboutsia sp. CE17]
MKVMKKFVFLSLATALLVTPTSAFADSSLIVSEEGIGMEVYNPIMQNEAFSMINQNTRSTIDGDKVDVAGGKLWTTWKDGREFKGNYYHSTKEHRSSAKNSTSAEPKRSKWVSKGITAVSPWVSQTAFGNRVFGATK